MDFDNNISDTGEKWEYNAVHQLLIDFKDYNSVRREIFNNLTEFGYAKRNVFKQNLH
jgi:hypothetical protein